MVRLDGERPHFAVRPLDEPRQRVHPGDAAVLGADAALERGPDEPVPERPDLSGLRQRGEKRRGPRMGARRTALATILLMVFASVAILHFESEPESNIKTAEDAVWWSIATVTTVGYGDHYPVTWEGRMIAVVLMLLGMCLVGVLSGLFASWFTAPIAAENRGEIEQLQVEIAALRKAIEAQAQRGTNGS